MKKTYIFDDRTDTFRTGFNRNQERFEDYADACCQARAFANFFAGSGRFLVFEKGGKFIVKYDECGQRQGIEETHLWEYAQHCNSGTYTWKEASTFDTYFLSQI